MSVPVPPLRSPPGRLSALRNGEGVAPSVAWVCLLWAGVVTLSLPAARVQADEVAIRPGRERAGELVVRADRHRTAGDVAGALDLYRRALELDPYGEAGWAGLAAAYLARGDLASADEVLREATRRLPASAPVAILYAEMLERGGHPRQALSIVRAASSAARGRAKTDLLAVTMDLATRVGAFAEALASARSIVAGAAPRGRGGADPELSRRAADTARALEALLGPLDPVAGVECDREIGAVMRALARCPVRAAAAPLAPR